MTIENQPSKHLSPLAKAGIGLVAVSGLVVGAINLGGCEGDRPEQSNQTIPDSTTIPPSEGDSEWFEQYGWDRDWAHILTQENFTANLNTKHEFTVGAGRCIVTRTENSSYGDPGFYTVIKNPVIVNGKKETINFTTFSGFSIYDDPITNQRFYSTTTIEVIEGDIYSGSFGIIPGQTDVTDVRSELNTVRGPRIVLEPEELTGTGEYTLGSDIEDYAVGRVLRFPLDRQDLVLQHCIAPNVIVRDIPDSIL